mgnify:CR=1 FL=1
MSLYSTLEAAIDAAREEFLASQPDPHDDDASVSQFSLQTYVMQVGVLMWQA